MDDAREALEKLKQAIENGDTAAIEKAAEDARKAHAEGRRSVGKNRR